MAHRSPILGYNHNIGYRGLVFHVQTEDSGVGNPHIFTHLFHGGVILSSRRLDYDAEAAEDVVKALMQAQHKAVLKSLRRGDFDDKIDSYLGNHPDLQPRKESRAVTEPVAPMAAAAVTGPTDEGAATGPAVAEVIELDAGGPAVAEVIELDSGALAAAEVIELDSGALAAAEVIELDAGEPDIGEPELDRAATEPAPMPVAPRPAQMVSPPSSPPQARARAGTEINPVVPPPPPLHPAAARALAARGEPGGLHRHQTTKPGIGKAAAGAEPQPAAHRQSRNNVLVSRPPIVVESKPAAPAPRAARPSRVAPARTVREEPQDGLFEQNLISEKSLDEVILAYLSEDSSDD